MPQNIKKIPLKDLVLWTENPRDPISSNASNQDIADSAISHDKRSVWSLGKLLKSMGDQYHLNELPTVCYKDNKPVVYDGNRRVLIGMLIHGYVISTGWAGSTGFNFPEPIDCNVCDEKTALEITDRVHADSGTWEPLQRDIFKHEHMKLPKSDFLIFEESTGLISSNAHLNTRYVREEVLNSTNLQKIGFSTSSGKLKHRYQDEDDATKVLSTISQLISDKKTTTRIERGKIVSLLNQDSVIQKILQKPAAIKYHLVLKRNTNSIKPTPRTEEIPLDLFGGILRLQFGDVNNLYSDLKDIYRVINKSKECSTAATIVVRLGLRLLCETAFSKEWEKTVENEFDVAKNKLSQDDKVTLHTQGVDTKNIVSLLHIGAHNYTASKNEEQTLAISLIVGQILQHTHGIQNG